MGSFLPLPYETVPPERSEEHWLQLRVRILEFLLYLKRDDAETEQALRDIASRVKALMIESQDKSISIYQALNNRSL